EEDDHNDDAVDVDSDADEDDALQVMKTARAIQITHIPLTHNMDHACAIARSIFVTNFLDSTSSKDLWKLCQSYGTVVDVYIPNRRSKAGKRFAFVRFIKVDNVDRLVGNLCTL
nr:RNA-directed DNA polymerase, eukaryota, nucleotide-binding alpha-beta plait domain protein [Tanacetum cinerariifolium]